MISIPDLIGIVKAAVPDAYVNLMDKTGMSDHFKRKQYDSYSSFDWYC